MGQRFHNARAGSVTVSGCGVDSPPGARGAAGQGGGAHQERALLAHGSRPCRRRVRRRLLGGVTAVDRQGVARQYGHDHDAPHAARYRTRRNAVLVGGPLDGLLLDITAYRKRGTTVSP